MIVYRHVTTFGVTEQRWLSNLTDLEIVEADGRLLLVAANQVRGGISTYAISDPAAPITMLRTRPYLADFTYQGPPQITAIHMGGDTLIHVGQMGGASNLGVTLRGDIGAMSTFGWLFGTSLGPQVTALGQVDTGQAQVLYSAQGGGLTLTTHRMGADGALVRAGQATIATPAGTTDANLDKITDVSVDGQRILISISGNGNFIATHLVSASGALTPGMVHGADRGTGYDVPSDVDAVQFGGRTYVVMAATGSGTLTVFRLTADGRLTTVDHVLDEGTTRFQNATALETVVLGGRAFVFAGGADDGISVFTMLPDGRLLHLTTIIDTDAMTLADVTDIEARVIDGRILLFVGSGTETGVTQLVFEPGPIGATATAGAGTARGGTGGDLLVAGAATTRIEGGDGNDILVAGAGPVTLVGGAGADIFVPSRVTGLHPHGERGDDHLWRHHPGHHHPHRARPDRGRFLERAVPGGPLSGARDRPRGDAPRAAPLDRGAVDLRYGGRQSPDRRGPARTDHGRGGQRHRLRRRGRRHLARRGGQRLSARRRRP